MCAIVYVDYTIIQFLWHEKFNLAAYKVVICEVASCFNAPKSGYNLECTLHHIVLHGGVSCVT